MEHIIQFGVTIDEQKIIDVATNKAADEIISVVKSEINSYTKGWTDTKLNMLFKKEVKRVVDENKDLIIQKATHDLMVNMAKTKSVKDMIKKMEEGDI